MSRKDVILKIREDLKTGGVLILDAHKTAVDIIFSAIFIRIHLPKARIIIPMAGWLEYRKPNCFFFLFISYVFRINFIPVYRREELIEGEELQYASLYPNWLTPDIRRKRNQEYLELAQSAIKEPDVILFIATYGSTIKYKTKVKRGVKILMGLTNNIYMTKFERDNIFWHSTHIMPFKYDEELDLDIHFRKEYDNL